MAFFRGLRGIRLESESESDSDSEPEPNSKVGVQVVRGRWEMVEVYAQDAA